jgi:hypothetical protein
MATHDMRMQYPACRLCSGMASCPNGRQLVAGETNAACFFYLLAVVDASSGHCSYTASAEVATAQATASAGAAAHAAS